MAETHVRGDSGEGYRAEVRLKKRSEIYFENRINSIC